MLAVLCVSLLIVNVDNTILNVALPSIARSMGASSGELQWIVDAYAIVFAGLLLVIGSLGDRFGRKWTFLVGLGVFAVGSALAAFSGTPDRLIAARAFMGMGAAAIMPSTLSILISVFSEPGERARAIGIWSGTAGLGVAVGPVAGGWLLARYWWGSVFLVNVPIALIGAVAAAWKVPNSRNPHSHRPDPIGGFLSIVGMGLLLWAIIEAPTRTWTSGLVLGALAGAIAVLTGFILWERGSDHPMLRLRLFESRRFSIAMLGMAFVLFALMGGLFTLTQYLQFSLGYSPLAAGLRVAPIAGVLLVSAPLSMAVVKKLGTRWVVVIGMILISIGLLLESSVTVHGRYLDVLPAFLAIGIGVGMAMAPCTDSVMGAVPPDEAGVGAATNGAALQTGGALGVAVLGSLLNGRYRGDLAPRLAALHVPRAVSNVVTGSLGGALQVAGRVGGQTGALLTSTARRAFVSGMDLAVLTGGLVVASAALLVLVLLPNRPLTRPADQLAPPPASPATDCPASPAPSRPGSRPSPVAAQISSGIISMAPQGHSVTQMPQPLQ